MVGRGVLSGAAAGVTLRESSTIVGGTVALLSSRGRVVVAQGASVVTSSRGGCGLDQYQSLQGLFFRRIGIGNSGAGHGGDGGSCSGPGGVRD